MQITITFDPATLTDEDKNVLALLGGNGTVNNVTVINPPAAEKSPSAAKTAAAPKATTKAKTAPEKDEEPVDEPVDDEPDAADGATMEDAVALATKLVSSGQAAKVKAALAEAGAKRVSELGEDKIADFIASLS